MIVEKSIHNDWFQITLRKDMQDKQFFSYLWLKSKGSWQIIHGTDFTLPDGSTGSRCPVVAENTGYMSPDDAYEMLLRYFKLKAFI